MKPANKNITKLLKIVEQMISLADKGDSERDDVACGVLYGILRDAGYKIKKLAEAEKDAHIRKGFWP